MIRSGFGWLLRRAGFLCTALLLLAPVSGRGAGKALSPAAELERKNACEDLCRRKNWKCRMKSEKKKEKDKERSMIICGTMFDNCVAKCQAPEK